MNFQKQKKKRKSKKYFKKKSKQRKLNNSQEQKYHSILKAGEYLSGLFPETIQINDDNDLYSFLDKHHYVILKPISQNLSTKMVKVLLNSNHQYEMQYGNEMLRFKDKEHMVSYLKENMKLEFYLAQRHIEFAMIKNDLFDLRLIVQKRKGASVWEVIERYAEVTNEIFTLQQAIQYSNLEQINIDKLLRNIDSVALQVAQKLGEILPNRRIWGLDIKIDSDGALWISKTYSKPPKVKGNKQRMYSFLKTDKYVSALFPETIQLQEQNDIWLLLDKYRHVVLKPISGSLGTGIIKILIDNDDQYEMQYRNKNLKCIDKHQILLNLKNTMKLKPYIVQEYIQLAKIKSCPFDLRVIVQRKKNEFIYTVTGMYAKVAYKGYFTTNLAKKGSVLTVNQAIECSNLKKVTIDELLRNINRAALQVAQKLGEISPHQRIWGLDIGIDYDGKLWIIEVNSNPGMKGFKRLENKSMYKTIQAYKRMN
ncbi:YheC/YheD family protein [Bacillus mycoides]|uniref:YheC/YheD family protein n=1 Tax=Bacillus mycoides TaxID=1405 RepID=UPI0002799877|nr:YheC/YheD family protein [Bacillus mycoides]EJR95103.1 hypothetical protein IKM_05482 [Bacillus mycoides]